MSLPLCYSLCASLQFKAARLRIRPGIERELRNRELRRKDQCWIDAIGHFLADFGKETDWDNDQASTIFHDEQSVKHRSSLPLHFADASRYGDASVPKSIYTQVGVDQTAMRQVL
jgi:hypothetical protein